MRDIVRDAATLALAEKYKGLFHVEYFLQEYFTKLEMDDVIEFLIDMSIISMAYKGDRYEGEYIPVWTEDFE